MKATKKAKPAAAKPVKATAAKPVTAAEVQAKPQIGAAAALKTAGDMTGPFKLSPAALAAKTPDALGLRKDSARFNIMKYAFAHQKEKIDRADLERIAGAQTGQALSGCVRYRFLVPA